MIGDILQHNCFKNKPPLLVDVGASGDIHKIWARIAKHCVCIAFDADERDLKISKDTGRGFKEFYLMNRIVSDTNGYKEFYLTNSPHCSSTLKTSLDNLKHYHNKNSFEIKKKITLPSITLNSALKEVGFNYIDWFKTDSQGTDLRIFSSLENDIIERVLVAEFEPGILDAYLGEDKLYKIMEYFDKKDYWCDACEVRGLSRISEKILESEFSRIEKRYLPLFQKTNAYWAEISYLNNLSKGDFQKREYLLMISFAIIREQFGFALEIATKAFVEFGDEIFIKIKSYVIKTMKKRGYRILPFYFIKRVFQKLVTN